MPKKRKTAKVANKPWHKMTKAERLHCRDLDRMMTCSSIGMGPLNLDVEQMRIEGWRPEEILKLYTALTKTYRRAHVAVRRRNPKNYRVEAGTLVYTGPVPKRTI